MPPLNPIFGGFTKGVAFNIAIYLNLIFGFTMPQIDNGAHIGGLLTGFIVSILVFLPGKKKIGYQIAAFICYLAIIGGLLVFGIQHNADSAKYQLTKIDELLDQDNYEQVIQVATKGLEDPGGFDSAFLFQRAYANIKLGKTSLAIEDLEKTVNMGSDMPEASYNLALLYFNQGANKKAKQAIKEAYELKPNNDSYIQLYEQITGKTVE